MDIALQRPAFPVRIDQVVTVLGISAFIMLIWQFLTLWIRQSDPTAGLIDPGTWQLLLLAVVSFILLTVIALGLLHVLWGLLGLPGIYVMVAHFKLLTPWKQFIICWASYALLFLGSLLSLLAIF